MQDEDRRTKFMRLYSPVDKAFQKFCLSRSSSRDDAKDLISESILTAFEKIHSLRDEKAFLHFLFGIATNLNRRKIRRKKFWGFFNKNIVEQVVDVSNSFDERTELEFLKFALAELPERYRDVLELHYISGFNLHEIGEIQGLNVSTVKVRLMRARHRLSKLLKGELLRSNVIRNLNAV